MGSIREIALAKAIGGGGGGGVTPEPLSVTANGTYTAPSGKAYTPVTVNVPSGGDGSVPAKAVNFRDYDGIITNAYSKAEFLALSAMPANPSHDGLTAQGWNWSLADAQAYVTQYGRLEVGQMYITDDGKTRVYIHLEEGRTSPMLGVCPNGTVDVDWGDGTAHDTLTGSSTTTVQWTPNHAYAAPGDYVIKLTVTGSMGFYGVNLGTQGSGLLRYADSSDNRNYIYRNAIKKVEVGGGVTNIGEYAFAYCYALTNITIPDSAINISNYVFSSCYSLKSVSIPNSATSIGNGVFNNCYTITSVSIPNSVTSIGDQMFYFCYDFAIISIPEGITSIGSSAFNSCFGLSVITIPDSVTSISNYAFSNCYSVAEYHLAPTTPPTLGTTIFNNIPADCIIYVPYSADHSVLNAYKTASGWSTYASKMQEEPE